MLLPVGKIPAARETYREENEYHTKLVPMFPAFNVAVQTIARRLFPCGFDVTKPGTQAPSTLADLTAHIRRTGRMLVSGEHSDRTIYSDPEINFAFRAWHDWHHYRGKHEFNDEGERAVYMAQCRDLDTVYGPRTTAEFKRILEAEVIGQLEYKRRHGEFPADQRAFVVAFLVEGFNAAARYF